MLQAQQTILATGACVCTHFRLEGALAGLFWEALGELDPPGVGQGRGKPGRVESPLGRGGVCTASATKTIVTGKRESSSHRRKPSDLPGAW